MVYAHSHPTNRRRPEVRTQQNKYVK